MIPKTKVDYELAAGVGILGVAFFDMFGKYTDDGINVANGLLSHYSGQIARNSAREKKFSLVAGEGSVGALPQGTHYQYPGTQHAAPHDDPVAAMLARSGV
jgi:hypothetical protein